MSDEVFLDTAYAIALSSATDALHSRAVRLAAEIQTQPARLITTRAVVLEIGNALAKQRYRSAAVQLLRSLEADSNVLVLPLSDELFEKARRLYEGRPDKEWGLTDCVSFIVMAERGITEALTADEHFQQAGFRALLRS